MSLLYTNGKYETAAQNLDFLNDDIYIAFMDPAYTPDPDTHENYDDIAAYVAAGSVDTILSSKTLTKNATLHEVIYDAADISLASQTILGGTNQYVLYKKTGSTATDTLIACIDAAEGTLSPVNDTFAIAWSASGIFGV